MAKYQIVKLKNLSPLHIGTGKENYDFSSSELQSDTLTAALAAIRVQTSSANNIEEFLNSFSLSSAFPYVHLNNKTYYFMPKALGNLNISVIGEKEEDKKRLKKIKYIDLSLWLRLVAGEHIKVTREQIQGEFLFVDIINEELYKTQVHQRVSVPRAEEDAEPFFFEWKFFNDNCGLFCFVDIEAAQLNEIVKLFQFLGEAGIGTDRNIGGGKFDVEQSEIMIDNNQDANAIILLSMYIPTKEEFDLLNLHNSKYSLQIRGGYIAGSSDVNFRHLRKKSIYMFSVGSIFPYKTSLKGKVVNLRPEYNDDNLHNVYRSGKPFVFPIKI